MLDPRQLQQLEEDEEVMSDDDLMQQEAPPPPVPVKLELKDPEEDEDKKEKNKVKWKVKPTLEELKHDFNEVKGSRSAYIAKLDTWDKLYDAPKFGDDKSTSSRINPKLVRKQVEWRCPALSEPFLSTNNIFDIKPLTHEDTHRAKQNSLILNRQFNTQLDKVQLVDKVIRKVVKEGTAIIRLGWAFREETVTETVTEFEYIPLPPEAMEEMGPQFEQHAQMKEMEPDSFEQLPEELKASVEMSLQEGQLFQAQAVGETEQEVTKTLWNKPTAEVCNIRNVYVDPTCNGDIDKAEFVIYSYESSLSDLKKDDNFMNLDDLNMYEEGGSLEHDNPSDTLGFKFADKARKKLIVYEYWGYWDVDGNGKTKPIIVSWVGDTIIRMDDNPFPDGKPPFVVFNYLPEENSIYGIPDAELLGDNQEILGATMRGVIDLLGKSANAQTGYSKNFLDASNQIKFRRGEDYMYNQGMDPRVHIHTHKFPEIPNSAMNVIQMVNNEAESMSGVKAFGQDGLSAVNFGDTATGVRGVLDAVSKREMSVLRRISDGFIKMARKIISMNSEFLSEEEVIRVTNDEFITVRRDDLAGEYDITITVATAEADNAKAQELAFMLQTMGDSMGQDVMKMILVEIARLRKMPDLAKAIDSYAPEPDPMMQQTQELEMAKQEAEIALIQAEAAETQAKASVYEAKIAVEQARAKDLEGSASNKALDFIEKDSGAKSEREMAKQQMDIEGQLAREDLKNQGKTAQMREQHDLGLLNNLAQSELQAQQGMESELGAMPDLPSEPPMPTGEVNIPNI